VCRGCDVTAAVLALPALWRGLGSYLAVPYEAVRVKEVLYR
jgi:hypothetical protein